jgi:hypothetical protein
LVAWRKDVIDRNVDALTKRTWPEAREAAKRHLTPPRGQLYLKLYGGAQPLDGLLRRVKPETIVIFEHRINEAAAYVVGCYSTQPGHIKRQRTYAQLQAADERTTFCLEMVQSYEENRGWMVDYTFAGNL